MGSHDDILMADVDIFLAEFGEPVIVYPTTGASRSVTGIVVRGPAKMESNPRTQVNPVSLQLPNDAVTGISGAEFNNRFEVDVPRYRGGPAVRMRIVKASSQDAAMITWELG